MDASGGLEWSTLQIALELSKRGHHLSVIYGSEGVLSDRYKAAKIEINGPVSFAFSKERPLRSVAGFRSSASFGRAFHPDVLWLNRFENIQWAETVAFWSGCPVVCHLRHMPNPGRESVFRHTVAHFVAISDFMRDAWIEAGVSPGKISVINNSLPDAEYVAGGVAERSRSRAELGLPDEPFIVLCYGRILEEKGVGTLLDAWAKLDLEPSRALLLLVGSPSPSDVPELAPRLARLKPSGYRWFPMQENVIPFLYAADLVAFPTWLEEGFGRVVIEGMKTGRPVVASRIGAVSELFPDSMKRFLFEPRNSDELTERIRELLDWRLHEPELAAACSQWVQHRFPFDENVSKFETVLREFARHRRTMDSR